jgi:hypothetical protein
MPLLSQHPDTLRHTDVLQNMLKQRVQVPNALFTTKISVPQWLWQPCNPETFLHREDPTIPQVQPCGMAAWLHSANNTFKILQRYTSVQLNTSCSMPWNWRVY